MNCLTCIYVIYVGYSYNIYITHLGIDVFTLMLVSFSIVWLVCSNSAASFTCSCVLVTVTLTNSYYHLFSMPPKKTKGKPRRSKRSVNPPAKRQDEGQTAGPQRKKTKQPPTPTPAAPAIAPPAAPAMDTAQFQLLMSTLTSTMDQGFKALAEAQAGNANRTPIPHTNMSGTNNPSPSAPVSQDTASEVGTVEIPASSLDNQFPVIKPIPTQHSVVRPLSARVPQKVKSKIWEGEYIELGSLLDRKQTLRLSTKSKPGQESPSIVWKEEKAKWLSIDEWTDAFNIYSAVWIEKFPDQAVDLLTYQHLVRKVYNDGGEWRFYDEEFRKSKQDDSTSWSQVDHVLFSSALVHGARKQPFRFKSQAQEFRQNQSLRVPRGSCFKFHKGFFCSGCRFSHRCFKCDRGDHPASKCRTRQNGNQSWSNQNHIGSTQNQAGHNQPQSGQNSNFQRGNNRQAPYPR